MNTTYNFLDLTTNQNLSMSVKKLITMFATVTASFAVPTIVHAAQEKPAMQTATPKPTKSWNEQVGAK